MNSLLLALLPLSKKGGGWTTGAISGALIMDAKLKLTFAGVALAGVAAVATLSRDEIAPSDPGVLRATGFLVRNHFRLDRNVPLMASVDHTARAFLGLTFDCARCHEHDVVLPRLDTHHIEHAHRSSEPCRRLGSLQLHTGETLTALVKLASTNGLESVLARIGRADSTYDPAPSLPI